MKVIHPSLFLVMKNFPNRKDALQKMYRNSDSFQALCENYQECSTALNYWARSESAQASERHREYLTLLQEIEKEIIQALN